MMPADKLLQARPHLPVHRPVHVITYVIYVLWHIPFLLDQSKKVMLQFFA